MCKVCWSLLIVVVLALSGAAYKFIYLGSVSEGSDGRQALQLTPAERNMVLGEMRDFLVAVQTILNATNQDDMKTAASAARRVGMAAQTSIPAGLIGKLPLEFKKLGFATHRKFDELALDAEQLGEPQHTREQLAQLMNNCVACHATYSIVATQ